MVATNGAVLLGARSSLDLHWQLKAWRFYGTPDGTAAYGIRTNQGAIGEVRFVMGWVAQQIGRIEWHVEIDGQRLDDAEAKSLMARVANEESTISIATNFTVAGEFNYVALSMDEIESLNDNPKMAVLVGPELPGDDDKRWMVVSVVDPFRRDLILAANERGLNLRAIWPHPARISAADPPLRSVLDVLEEIEQLQDVAFAQNRSRVAQMGILTVANEFDLAVPGGDFGTRLEEAINAPILDPRRTAAGPILLRGPFELMTGSLSNGARGVQWTKPVQDFDERIDDKMKFLIQRLAWGFPVAPEILLGMTATNRAVAFQIEESTYRSHVEPIAKLVGRTYARALAMILDQENVKVEVLPDATELLARRHSVADAKDAYDRGLVRAEWVRRVLGIDEEDAATQDDLDRIILLRKGANPGQAREPDPSEVSGNEPVRASASTPPDAGDLAASLRGATDMAYATAVSRIGAAARTRLARHQLTPPLEIDPDAISNQRLPSMLGPDRLDELGLDVETTIDPAADWLVAWWEAQLDGSYDETTAAESIAALRRAFVDGCRDGVCVWPLVRTGSFFADPVLAPLVVSVLESTTEAGGE